jgi:ABC-type enterochelin transport system permease subunit
MKRSHQIILSSFLFTTGSAAGLILFTTKTVPHPLLTYLAEISFIIQFVGLIWLIVLAVKSKIWK